MPIETTTVSGRPAYRYGAGGHPYSYAPGDEAARRRAKRLAIQQGLAIAHQQGVPFEGQKYNENHDPDNGQFTDGLGGGIGGGTGGPTGQKPIEYTKAEKEAVTLYATTSYREINDFERKGTRPDWLNKDVAALDRAIAKTSIPPPDTEVLYRGAAFSPELASRLAPNVVITDRAFVSTTTDLGTARGHAGQTKGGEQAVLFEVHKVVGAKGLYVPSIWSTGFSRGEQEVLLPRGSSFRVISVEKQGDMLHVKADLVR